MEEQYIASMSDKERIAYHIAQEHLGSSFDIQKSIVEKKNTNSFLTTLSICFAHHFGGLK